MEPQGIYNLSIDSEAYRGSKSRIGLNRRLTGVPVFLLFLEGVTSERRWELHTVDDVESESSHFTSPTDRMAWGMLRPFFEGDGSGAHVVALPLCSSVPTEERLAQFIGKDGGLKKRSGIHALKSFVEMADLVVVPQASSLLQLEAYFTFLKSLFATLSPLSHFFSLVDFPKEMDPREAIRASENLMTPDASAYFPWIIKDGIALPPTSLAAACFQTTDSELGIAEIPANRVLSGGYRPMLRLLPSELRLLQENRINAIHRFSHDTRVWGGKTLASPTDLDSRFNAPRRLLLAMREAITEICEPFVMEPLNTDIAHEVDVAINSAFQPILGGVGSEVQKSFKTHVSVKSKGTEDVLHVEVSYFVPFALDQMTFTMGMTG